MTNYRDRIIKNRKKLLRLTIKQRKEIIEIYNKAGEEVLEKLKSVKKGSLQERYLKELDNAIKQYKKKLNVRLENLIREYMIKAANLGIEPSMDYFENMDIPFSIKSSFKSMFTNISDDVVKLLVSGAYYKGGEALSKRIWNITNKNGNDIDKIIKISIAQQESINEIAKKLEKYLIKGAGTPQKTKIKGINSNISYQSVRLARTSTAHAHNEAKVSSSMENPFSTGVKWNLSSEHSSRIGKFGMTKDICDEYASQDNYDLGTGVFPAEKVPISHPNCLCYLTEEVEDIDKASDDIINWINGEENKELDKWAKNNGYKIKKHR